MSEQSIREFGDRVTGAHYEPRPGSYGVITGQDGRILLVQTATGLHLPGGGAEVNELPEQTLEREVREECGHRVTITRKIGKAIQLVFAENEGCFAKKCVFFQATLGDATNDAKETDHTMIWLEPTEAVRNLKYESQQWAVAQTLG